MGGISEKKRLFAEDRRNESEPLRCKIAIAIILIYSILLVVNAIAAILGLFVLFNDLVLTIIFVIPLTYCGIYCRYEQNRVRKRTSSKD